MKPSDQNRFNELYEQHLRALKLQGMSHKTIDAYARALRRIAKYFNRCPDHLSTEQLACYFSDLVDSHSWSTVTVDRNGLQFFYKHVLKRDWTWVEIIKPPKIQSLPDILTLEEIGRLISATRKLRYRVFLLTTYSLGLRLSEALSLQVSDIDSGRHQVHVRRGKGCKDRLVPLPDFTCRALRNLWSRHRHPQWIFPNALGSPERIARANGHMDRAGAQAAMKAVVQSCGIKKKSRSIHYATATLPTCSNRV